MVDLFKNLFSLKVRTVGKRLSRKTERCYLMDIRNYEKWRLDTGISGPFLTEDLLLRFLTFRMELGTSASTQSRAIYALAWKSEKLTGKQFVVSDEFRVLFNDAARRLSATNRYPIRPFTKADFEQICESLPSDLRGKRARALFALAYHAGMGVAGLRALDVQSVRNHEWGLIIRLTTGVPIIVQPDLNIYCCPVRAVLDWIAAANLFQGPVFVRIGRTGPPDTGRPLEDSVIHRLTKAAIAEAGLDEKLYSFLSFKAGINKQAAVGRKIKRAEFFNK